MIRKPIVSGQFYPEDKEELSKVIEAYLSCEASRVGLSGKISAKGIILPHAGYSYSGKVAVTTVNKVLPKKKLILLGTNHSGAGQDFSLWAKGSWEIPSGQIKIDEALAQSILSKGSRVKEDYLAHEFEHSLEVELPILQHIFGKFEFIPISCKTSALEAYQETANQIFEAVKNIKNEILFVASTDLTHYEPDSTARKKDRIVLEAIINLDEQSLMEKVYRENISICGLAPAVVLLLCLKKLGARKAQVALYQTSGDACGDYNSVVGYAGVIIK
ncbi:MAG: AmmeMemoRadiSam system protein B [Candidatus Omnitrophota bacterium]